MICKTSVIRNLTSYYTNKTGRQSASPSDNIYSQIRFDISSYAYVYYAYFRDDLKDTGSDAVMQKMFLGEYKDSAEILADPNFPKSEN